MTRGDYQGKVEAFIYVGEFILPLWKNFVAK